MQSILTLSSDQDLLIPSMNMAGQNLASCLDARITALTEIGSPDLLGSIASCNWARNDVTQRACVYEYKIPHTGHPIEHTSPHLPLRYLCCSLARSSSTVPILPHSMYLKSCLTLSMTAALSAALSAAASCPAGFSISCCATFQTQSDTRYLHGVDCKFAVTALTILRADMSIGIQPYQECPCPTGRTYRFCCVSPMFSSVY